MEKLRVSSTVNLHARFTGGVCEYIKDELEFMKKVGFEAADFNTRLLSLESNSWRAEAEKCLEHSKSVGIGFELCHLPYLFGSHHSEDTYRAFNVEVNNAIDAAKIIGAGYAVIHPNTDSVPKKDFDRAAYYDIVMKHLSPVVEYANRVGVNVVVENMRLIGGPVLAHRYCQDPDELCDIADALGVGVCWDFGHANISGVKQSEGLSYVGKRLKSVHVNDNMGVDDDHQPPFIGNIDWADAARGLDMIGYRGLFNYELHTKSIPDGARDAFARYIITAAEQIMSL